MAIDFPASPSLNDTFTAGGVTYTWDGTVWAASGSAAFVQKSGDTITGNLTLNADLTVDTDTLYVDSTNSRVGIGTDSPNKKLHVVDSGEAAVVKVDRSDASVAGELEIASGGTKNFVNSFGNKPLSIQTDQTERIHVSGTGEIGIGTDSPSANLDVVHSGSAAVIRANRSDASIDGEVQLSSGGNRNILNSFGNKTLDIQTDQTSRIRILGTGEVGIGKTSPAVELDVNGEVRASTGILFGTDTAAANTLDDYEEGTWTPVFAGATTAGTYTYTSQTGVYTKIGNRVTVDFKLLNITTSSAGSGDVRITGLPFTVGNPGLNAQGSVRMSRFNVDDSTISISIQANQETTECQITLTRDNNSNVTVNVNDKTTDGADIYGSVTYSID